MFTSKLFFWFLDMILLLAENSDTHSSDRESNLISSASLYEHVFNLYNLSSSSNSTDLVNLTDSGIILSTQVFFKAPILIFNFCFYFYLLKI